MPTINLENVSLYYEEQGAGEPLLLLHGLGSNGRSWEYQVEPFARQYRVIVPDVRGHGRSAKPTGPYSVSQFANDIFNLLDHLQIDRFHLVGLSMGGMIGFQMAVDRPERLKSMTIVNSGPELIPRGLKEKWQILQRRLITRFVSMAKIGEIIGGKLFPEPHQAAYKSQFIEQMSNNDPEAYKAATNALLGWSVSNKLARIQCPILVISADMDYTPVAFKEAYVRQLPTARLQVIENSRHATPIDQPEVFNTAVLQFLHTVG
ncbi:MAG: alpha/beta fold hydrolase [Ardenticatenaceae bacterium]|nr:alpha/beta fold hydrolase [Ardenticatenaceae bacterium]MCB8973245.1 alpha/beta fold hydrolase [Ardenticatenaceae bacterium]